MHAFSETTSARFHPLFAFFASFSLCSKIAANTKYFIFITKQRNKVNAISHKMCILLIHSAFLSYLHIESEKSLCLNWQKQNVLLQFISKYLPFQANTITQIRVGRKSLRNRLNSVPDLIQDISWEKGQYKIRHHQRHQQRQPCEQRFPIQVVTGLSNFKHLF